MKTKNQTTRGFTLLEVLIAVLILGIIATVALPMLGSYTEKAREAREDANLREFELATQRYELVHKEPLGYLVDTSTDTLYDITGDDGTGLWMQLENPTDVNGNILGASLDPTASAFVYGPYLAPGSEPASLLLGAGASLDDKDWIKNDLDIATPMNTTKRGVKLLSFLPGFLFVEGGKVNTALLFGGQDFGLTQQTQNAARILDTIVGYSQGRAKHVLLRDAVFVRTQAGSNSTYRIEKPAGGRFFTVASLIDLLEVKAGVQATGDGKWNYVDNHDQAMETERRRRVPLVLRWLSWIAGDVLRGPWDETGTHDPQPLGHRDFIRKEMRRARQSG